MLLATAGAVLDLGGPLTAGLFTGSLTNTPALASVVATVRQTGVGDPDLPVVAYTLAYPMGVVGVLVAMQVAQRRWGGGDGGSGRTRTEDGDGDADIHAVTIRVERVDGLTIGELGAGHDWDVRLSRVVRDGAVVTATPDRELLRGDLVSVVGAGDDLVRMTDRLGTTTGEHPEMDRSTLDFRRMFVSNTDVAGRRIGQLHLAAHGAVVTRVRRGDVDLVAHDHTLLEMGDRVRVVAPRDQLPALARLFGDSYRALGEVDVMTLGLGIALGLLLGSIPVPLGGDTVFRLGFAGGPLVAGLALGATGRTGPLLWQIPYGANLTLRQLGVLLFLAGVGTRSGQAFAAEVGDPRSLVLLLVGALTTFGVASTTLWVGHRRLGIPMPELVGMLAGIQTQPAVLAFASEQTGDDRPATGYASTFPVAMVAKIVLAQLLVALLA